MNAFAEIETNFSVFKGDTLDFKVFLRSKVSESGVFAIPPESNFQVIMPGENGPILLEAPEVTLISYGSGGLTVTVSPIKSAELKTGNPTILIIVEKDSYKRTFEAKAPFSVKARPINV